MKIGKEKWATIQDVKRNVWKPKHPDDYLKLKPKLILTRSNPELTEKWNILRTFISTMPTNQPIGRKLSFLVIDDITKKYLGLICISSDFMDLASRYN